MHGKWIFFLIVVWWLTSCSALITPELDLRIKDDEIYLGKEIEGSISQDFFRNWDEITWYMDDQPRRECEGQDKCNFPTTETGTFEIKVKVKANRKGLLEQMIEDEKSHDVVVARTDPSLIGKYNLSKLLSGAVDVLPGLVESDSSYAGKLQITQDDFIVTIVSNNVSSETTYIAEQTDDDVIKIYFNGFLIFEYTYTLVGNVLILQRTIDGTTYAEIYDRQ